MHVCMYAEDHVCSFHKKWFEQHLRLFHDNFCMYFVFFWVRSAKKLPMATPTKASPSMHSVCFHETLEQGCSKTTEQNCKRFFASGTKFWLDSTQTGQICKKLSPSQRKSPKTCFRCQVLVLADKLACS
jgi:hypothetical protein